jgi:poly-gamma-glutamate synthesis protein (capsule biosynthesis protein)
VHLDVSPAAGSGTVWVYALVAPFPTVADDVTFNELISSWKGSETGPFAGHPLLMDESTLAAFTALWGPPWVGVVQTVDPDQLLDAAWSQRPSWAVVPFESLDPRWKVLAVDGQSPVRKDFELYRYHLMQASFDYPLAVNFALSCPRPCATAVLPELPSTNRDPAKMSTLVMTGVTALVRATAFTMNTKGITYPGRDIRDWLVGADVAHISNEVPFANDCPPPDPTQTKRLVFCSDPRYIELLTSIGTDVVELTGNHYADYGPEAMLLTLKLYGDNDMAHYGGGADLDDARKPLLLENKGNKLAFIGCNSVDIGRMPTATSTRPGAAPCDYDYMTGQIRELRDQGYIVIASFQYYETYEPKPFDAQMQDFRLMADAGAAIVQGSQAHNPQTMEFRGGSLIHYGLGNLFFDQMGDAGVATRHEFIDRHIFYNGAYISTELLTAELEDYARPQPMTPEQRAAFLSRYFAASGW